MLITVWIPCEILFNNLWNCVHNSCQGILTRSFFPTHSTFFQTETFTVISTLNLRIYKALKGFSSFSQPLLRRRRN